jgi:hypothetical protein
MDRGAFLRLGGTGLAGAVLLGTAGGAALARTEPSLRAEFGAASEEYGVPEDLILAMGYVNTRWEMPPPDASPYEPDDLHGRGTYGIMQLVRNPWRDTLGAAAALTGLSEEKLKASRAANVQGGAAMLSEIQGENTPRDLDGWYYAVAEYGDGVLYADQVYEVLESGASSTTSGGEKIDLAPQRGVESRDLLTRQAAGDYPGSRFYGAHSNNYWSGRTYRRRTYDVNKIVVHVMQGSWSGTLNHFNDSQAGVSCHYSVRSSDGVVGQSVRERSTAYQAGHWITNLTSVGIEHEGYIGKPRWFTAAMYRSSAKLAAYLCKKHRIPVDRDHIIGHNQVPGCSGGSGGGVSCHTDPGRYWDWARYMRLIAYYRSRV